MRIKNFLLATMLIITASNLRAQNNPVTVSVKLNKNLLLLSKIDSNSYYEIEKINLPEIINNQLTFFSEQALSKK